jgi:hypothetical protein
MAVKIVERDMELDIALENKEINGQKHAEEKTRIKRQKRLYDSVVRQIEDYLSDDEIKKRLETERINMTDPDSAIMTNSSKNGYIQGYNALIMVSNNDVILDIEPITDGERNHTDAMVERVESLKKTVGSEAETNYLLDSGFENMEKIIKLEDAGLHMFVDVKERDFNTETHKRKDFTVIPSDIGPRLRCRNNLLAKGYLNKEGTKYTFIFERSRCKGCKYSKDCYKKIKKRTMQKSVTYSKFEIENSDKINRYMDKIRGEKGKKIYSRRIGKEHVNANIKGQRDFLQTYYRGNEKVRMDLFWVAVAQNMVKYSLHKNI